MKICHIGCGGIANTAHGPSQRRYKLDNPGVSLAGACDIRLGAAQEYADKFGFLCAYVDFKQMLALEKPDAVVVAVPEENICEIAEAVLRMGFPTLCEKPPGKTMEENIRLSRAAKDTINAAAFNRRCMPLVIRCVEKLREIGEPPEYIRYEMFRVNRRDGNFEDTAIHGIDLVRFLAGADFKELFIEYPGTNYLAAGRMENGAAVSMAFCPLSGVLTERFAVNARGHTIYVDLPVWGNLDSPGMLHHYRDGQLVEETAGEGELFITNGFYQENKDFYDCVTLGKPSANPISAALQSVEVAHHLGLRVRSYHAK